MEVSSRITLRAQFDVFCQLSLFSKQLVNAGLIFEKMGLKSRTVKSPFVCPLRYQTDFGQSDA